MNMDRRKRAYRHVAQPLHHTLHGKTPKAKIKKCFYCKKPLNNQHALIDTTPQEFIQGYHNKCYQKEREFQIKYGK